MIIDFFGAKWCTSCKGQLEAWKTYATKYGHTVNYIDVDENAEDAGEAGVKSVPTIILPDGSRFGVSLPSDILKACSKL